MSNGILVDSLESELSIDNLTDVGSQEAPQKDSEQEQSFAMPDKFKNKSAEEIAQVYLEEQHYRGELQNQLGEYRQMTDRLLNLEEKRTSDLEKGGAEDIESYDIDPTDLLSNPKEVLDAYLEQRLSQDDRTHDLQERLDRIERQTVQEQFQSKHNDAAQLVADDQFVNWVNSNPYRSNMAAQAVTNQDYNSLDYLLTDYKERFSSGETEAPSTQKAKELSRAKSVVTESSSSGGSSNRSKVYSRREIVNLKVTKPEEYRQRADEFTQAYQEGRVTD